jgi:DNA-binding HxlR family transcriptional regulator
VSVFAPLVGPWNLELLFLLYVEGPQRFSALKRTLAGVSSRVLTDKARHLEREGLATRRAEGRAVTYALTERGATVARHLHPIVFYLRNEAALARPA